MIHIEDYIQQSNESRRTLYRRIQSGELPTTKIGGRTYIITDETKQAAQSSIKKNLKKNIKEIKQQLDDIIIYEGPKDKTATVKKIEQIVSYWQSQGTTIKGYNAKSIYRKITLGKVQRKTRGDFGGIRNRLIAAKLESHILPLAAFIYLQNVKANLKLTVDLMIEYAKTNEDFYEIAAIPPATLYKNLKREFMDRGMEDKHEYLNHYNLWFKKRAFVTGAFTDDIEFMEYLLGDDNKRNVASAWIYNEHTRRNELKQIKSWNWVEAKTGKVLSFVNTTGELNTEDVINTLIEALQQTGLPKKGIIIDNGIGSSERFKNFFDRLNIGIELIQGPGNKIILKLGKPYHPTDKAPIERSFGWTKDEHDSFFKNFVGDNHKLEGFHKTNSLTPEQANYTFQDYDKSFNQFIHGFYETRKRKRAINEVTEEISIRDFFNREWDKHVLNPVPDRAIRFALQVEKEFTYKGGAFEFSLAGYRSDYLPTGFMAAMPSSFYNRRFKILYNPNQPDEVDLYATESFVDKIEGLFFDRGEFICTLKAVRAMDNEKQKAVAMHNRAMQKAASHLKFSLIAQDALSQVNQNAQLIDAPKEIRRAVVDIIKNEKPLEKIAEEAFKRVKTKHQLQQRITEDELDEILNSNSQSAGGGTNNNFSEA